MNLIEQLGYEKAKEAVHRFLNLQLNEGNPDDVLLLDYVINNRVKPEDILLEYRRQHNIFEAGDKVVSRCADNETRIFTYHLAIGKNIIAKCKKGKGYCYPKKWFSHATDEEIKAGKRLEVDDEK